MAKCEFCKREEKKANGCSFGKVVIKGKTYERITFGKEEGWADVQGDCHDCGAKKGYFHHYGCDVEECPACNEQFFGCGCNINEFCGDSSLN